MSTLTFSVELDWPGPIPGPDPSTDTGCAEIGRVTRAYVSAYDRARVHHSRLYSSEIRCLVANFNGAIPVSRSIIKAVWQTNQRSSASMSAPSISSDGREATVLLNTGWAGTAAIKCSVTLDNGEKYIQQFLVDVLSQPYYSGDTFTTGPQSVTVEV